VTKECLKCNNTCNTCSGPAYSECSTCLSSRILFKPSTILPEKYCTTTCSEASGFYVSGTSCLKCHPTCKECNAGTAFNCT
jgi:hypothetical protein